MTETRETLTLTLDRIVASRILSALYAYATDHHERGLSNTAAELDRLAASVKAQRDAHEGMTPLYGPVPFRDPDDDSDACVSCDRLQDPDECAWFRGADGYDYPLCHACDRASRT